LLKNCAFVQNLREWSYQAKRLETHDQKDTNMTKAQQEEYDFHIESAEFYQEMAHNFRKTGEQFRAFVYERDCVAMHMREAQLILEAAAA
jgi:hypothetical protein